MTSDVPGWAPSPEALGTQPSKPKPSRAQQRAQRASRLGSYIHRPEPGLESLGLVIAYRRPAGSKIDGG